MRKGLLIILSGPSGVGKGTVRSYLMSNPALNLAYSISCTTRLPRKNEVDGKDYFFVSKDEFLKRLDNNEFLEHAEFCDNYYGTLKSYVDKLRDEGKNVIVEIETNGAMQIINKLDNEDEISIFITCSSFDELERRIRGRNTETETTIYKRLTKAREELNLAKYYDYIVDNDKPENCANHIKQIILNKLQYK